MKKIKKGDEVIVIAGKDKGKRGKIHSLIDGGERLIVSGINYVKKHTKGNPQAGQQGGVLEKEAPIHCSNVMLYDEAKSKGSRIGIRILKDGERVRYFKSSDQAVDVKG
jgi:large subunit ribosomal protein L24